MTKEITIRPITYDDTEDIIRWRNSDFVRSRFIDQRLFTKESHEYWLKNFVETGKVAQFIILLDKKSVGSVYLKDINREEKSAEYGIFIGDENAIGIGVGTKSARLILEYAFNELKLEKVYLRAYKDNACALKSYEKAGFVYKGKTESIEVNGEKRDIVFMELEKKDFEKR